MPKWQPGRELICLAYIRPETIGQWPFGETPTLRCFYTNFIAISLILFFKNRKNTFWENGKNKTNCEKINWPCETATKTTCNQGKAFKCIQAGYLSQSERRSGPKASFEIQTKAARRGTFAQVARRVKIKSKKSPDQKNFKVHIYKVLLSVHRDATISAKAMTLMNSLIFHAFEKIATEASKLAKCNKKSGRFSKLKRSPYRLRPQKSETFWKPG